MQTPIHNVSLIASLHGCHRWFLIIILLTSCLCIWSKCFCHEIPIKMLFKSFILTEIDVGFRYVYFKILYLFRVEWWAKGKKYKTADILWPNYQIIQSWRKFKCTNVKYCFFLELPKISLSDPQVHIILQSLWRNSFPQRKYILFLSVLNKTRISLMTLDWKSHLRQIYFWKVKITSSR